MHNVAVGRDVGAVIQTIRVLRAIASDGNPLGVTAIARKADVSPSTTLNILRTLVNEGVLGFNPIAKSYWPAIGLLELARPLLNQSQAEVLRPHLLSMATTYGALFSVWAPTSNEHMILVDRVVPDVVVRVEMRLATKLPIAAGAIGRAMMSLKADDEALVLSRFAKVRWQEPMTFGEYMAEVRTARTNGFAVDASRLIRGVTAVGAAVPDAAGRPALGLSAITLSGQHGSAELSALGRQMAKLANTAQQALFGHAMAS